jgi:DNA polymerase-3 subunit epsilon
VHQKPHPIAKSVRESRFVAIDFESAGAERGQTDHVVQIGLACCDGLDFSTMETYRTFLRPEAEVAWTASRVHGIDAGMVENAPAFRDIWPAIRARMENRLVVAHGAATEKRHLRAFPLHGFGPWVDTLVLARKVWPLAPSHRLGELVGGLGMAEEVRRLCPNLHWHDALFDAVGALVLLRSLVERAGLWDHPPGDLVNARLAVRPRQD